MRKLFGKKKKNNPSDKDQKAKKVQAADSGQAVIQKATDTVAKQVQAILVFSQRPLGDPNKLLQQISEQQRSNGYMIAQKCIVKGISCNNPEDNAVISALVRKEFPSVLTAELAQRTNVYPFQASDGNAGKYCIVFDRT